MKEFLEKIDFRRILRYLLFLLLCLLAQEMVLSHIHPFGVRPLILPALAAALGMFEGATAGAVYCLVLGYFADMGFVEHRMFFVLLLPVLSLLSAFVSQFFINRCFFAFMGVALLELLITAALQLLKTLAGDVWGSEMLVVAALQTLWSLPFAALAYILPARWSREGYVSPHT